MLVVDSNDLNLDKGRDMPYYVIKRGFKSDKGK